MSATDTAIKGAFDTFGKFLYRDMLYVVGGITVLLSIRYTFGRPEISLNTATLIYVSFLGYIIGYALQEVLSFSQLVTTGYRKLTPRYTSAMKLLAPHVDWDSFKDFEYKNVDKLLLCVDAHANTETRKRIDRIINLKHIGASGASFGVASIILFCGSYKHQCECHKCVLPLAISAFVLSVILVLTSHIKCRQQLLIELAVNETCGECETIGINGND